jgi:serine/threonine protein kinase/tetratricopeptide (TPR) repeat protein
MSNAHKGVGAAESDSSVLADLIDRLTAKMQAGEPIDWEDVARQHPEHAGELLQLGPALGALGHLSKSGPAELSGLAAPAVAEDGLATGVLGDFRVVREVGRGAMGVVYEAEQVSLGRRVALKVLPFAATMDPRALQRFQNEARAAACLHHTNVVPVYYVGCERGIHFYAMQFIDGQTLADLIRELRQSDGQAFAPDERTTAHKPSDEVADPKADTEPAARQSTLATQSGARGREFFRRAAGWGVQAAEALDHAHQAAIVHRDVKPGNLLLDGRGQLWVADFGLAHVRQGEAGLTMTGDLVGTLRYMSPEQALAKRVPIDHRTDIYSLGATLYELLTLRPVLTGKDRQELLRQIAFEEPTPPRRLNKAIPQELEIIVLKAMEKNPTERYATAQEMADDLRRFLDDKPIRARRPSWRQVASRWARRHWPAVTAAATTALIAALFAAGAGLTWANQRAVVQVEVGRILQEAATFQEEGKWPEALAAARHAEAAAMLGPTDEGLRERVRRRRADLDMVAKVEEIRLLNSMGSSTAKEETFDTAVRDPEYAQAFRQYGVDVVGLGPADVGARIRATSVSVALAAALDDWAMVCKKTRKKGDARWKDLLAAARAADPDDWRNQVRDALDSEPPDQQALINLASSDRAADQPPSTLVLIGNALKSSGAVDQAAALLRSGQRRHPGDFWINEQLATMFLDDPESKQQEEGVRFATAASALHPQSPGAICNLGNALNRKGSLDEAVAAYKEAIRLKSGYAEAYNNLAISLDEKGLPDKAVAACKEAIRLKPGYAEAYLNLGAALLKKGSLDEAIAAYKKAIRLKSDFAMAYNNLGNALVKKGSPDDAVTACKEAIRLKPNLAMAYENLGNAFFLKGALDGAIAAYREAIRLKPDCEVYSNLAAALDEKGLPDEAVAACKEALRLQPDFAMAYSNLGAALFKKGSLDDAVAAYKAAIRLKPDLAVAYNNLGQTLFKKGSPDEAVAACKEAIRLKPDYAEAYSNLGDALGEKGCLDDAVAAYKEAIRIQPDDAAAHCNLALVLGAQGQFRAALAAMRRGDELGSRQSGWRGPSAEWMRVAEREAILDALLPAILRGQASPADASAALDFAVLCQQPYKRLYAASARFFADAFAAEPALAENLDAQASRYNAASAAALAGCGKGDDKPAPNEEDRARLRRQALDWLRADLAGWRAWRRQQADSDAPAVQDALRKTLQHWREDTDLAGVRDDPALAALPEAERAEWKILWADVDKTLAKVQDAAPEGKVKDKP